MDSTTVRQFGQIKATCQEFLAGYPVSADDPGRAERLVQAFYRYLWVTASMRRSNDFFGERRSATWQAVSEQLGQFIGAYLLVELDPQPQEVSDYVTVLHGLGEHFAHVGVMTDDQLDAWAQAIRCQLPVSSSASRAAWLTSFWCHFRRDLLSERTRDHVSALLADVEMPKELRPVIRDAVSYVRDRGLSQRFLYSPAVLPMPEVEGGQPPLRLHQSDGTVIDGDDFLAGRYEQDECDCDTCRDDILDMQDDDDLEALIDGQRGEVEGDECCCRVLAIGPDHLKLQTIDGDSGADIGPAIIAILPPALAELFSEGFCIDCILRAVNDESVAETMFDFAEVSYVMTSFWSGTIDLPELPDLVDDDWLNPPDDENDEDQSI